ncbi:MAG TPA: Gfo/Idh/MocA family oxidoreductase [Gemmatimonadaceae bacterium]|nr:Gfo/Idh/MocA family oxidoreductase [Gemmatimonadaceae bacterium]
MSDVTNVAVIGLGTAGLTLHMPALAELPFARVVGACDPDPERRTQARALFGVPTYEDYEEMLNATSPHVVIVATPPDSHAEYCIEALARGAHVVCEKPFTSSLEEADRVIEAAARAGRQVALNHEFREMPIFRALRREVREGDAGELLVVQVWQLMDLPPWKERGWRGRLLQRTLYEAGVHLVDYVMDLFGEKPRAVSATISSCGARAEASDAVALVTMEFSGGRLAHITQNRLCRGETQYFEVRADCTEASLRASFGGRARLSAGFYRSTKPHLRLERGVSGIAWRENGTHRRALARNPRNPGMHATREILKRSLEAFDSSEAPPVSAARAREVLEVIAACYYSAGIGARVALTSEAQSKLVRMRLGENPAEPL